VNARRRLLLAAGLALVWPALGTAAPELPAIPAPGSPERGALLDAVRAALGLNAQASRFKVLHLRRAGVWAYFEGNELVPLEGREWQETDLTVKALLRFAKGAWPATSSARSPAS